MAKETPEAVSLGLKNIKSLNNETAVANALAEGISKKESADLARQLLSPFSGGTIG